MWRVEKGGRIFQSEQMIRETFGLICELVFTDNEAIMLQNHSFVAQVNVL